MAELERRFTPGQVELRNTAGKPVVGGYAAVFNKRSRNLGGFVEQVAATFFNKSAGDGWPDVLARYNHDDNMLLGTTGSGTLQLRIDQTGLLYEVDLPASRADVLELVTRGDIRHSSFAFRVVDDDWTMTEQNYPLRTLLSGQLIDVAPVNSPAYPDSTAGLRSLASRVGVEFAEVRSLAAQGQLARLLRRTDRPATTFGASAVASLLGRR